jgi:formylglycine-generating enzyme required for sulfatase activity
MDDPFAEAVLRAGEALKILDRDAESGSITFTNNQLQEYFAARHFAKLPDFELTRVEWRAAFAAPDLQFTIEGLGAGETLPGLPRKGWEETARLATSMSEQPEGLLRGLKDANLALAARCAIQEEVRVRLPDGLMNELRLALVLRSRDPEADLRDRIACGRALGRLGDPRIEVQSGPQGRFRMPQMVEVPEGDYPIGDDFPIERVDAFEPDLHVPLHRLRVAGFQMGCFPVTRAEYAHFVEAGGYEDERWWDSPASKDWRRGIGTAEGHRDGVRSWRQKFREDPSRMKAFLESGAWTEDLYAAWRRRVEMSEDAFERQVVKDFPEQRITEPSYWRDAAYSNPALPALDLSWFEARAYCAWLAAQTGIAFRLPTEVEWEAAARGLEGRRYAWGDRFDRRYANLVEAHMRGPTPAGVFPSGDTPQGLSDMTGNVWEWTSSACGGQDPKAFSYPYQMDDGREDPSAGLRVYRVLRGGSWLSDQSLQAMVRINTSPATAQVIFGFRLAASPGVQVTVS